MPRENHLWFVSHRAIFKSLIDIEGNGMNSQVVAVNEAEIVFRIQRLAIIAFPIKRLEFVNY